MKFTNFKNKLERPFIVYADMESTLIKTDKAWYSAIKVSVELPE